MDSLSKLWEAFAMALIPIVPAIVAYVWRHIKVRLDVRSAAIRVEASDLVDNAEKKREAVRDVKNTLFGKTMSAPGIERLVESLGVPAANEYRRKSIEPKAPK